MGNSIKSLIIGIRILIFLRASETCPKAEIPHSYNPHRISLPYLGRARELTLSSFGLARTPSLRPSLFRLWSHDHTEMETYTTNRSIILADASSLRLKSQPSHTTTKAKVISQGIYLALPEIGREPVISGYHTHHLPFAISSPFLFRRRINSFWRRERSVAFRPAREVFPTRWQEERVPGRRTHEGWR